MWKPKAVLIMMLVLGTMLVACGAEEPALCVAADDLRGSVDDLRAVDVSSSTGITDLETGIAAVRADLRTVRSESRSEFTPELDAVETAHATLEESVVVAKSDPNVTTLEALVSASSSFVNAAETLVTDIQAIC